jgi:serine phosphatase RsbU (regulator of sigma subunit)
MADTERLTDEQKLALQQAADDPKSGLNRAPIERANELIKAHVEGLQLRQWAVDRALTAHVNEQTVKLAREIYAFLRE